LVPFSKIEITAENTKAVVEVVDLGEALFANVAFEGV
jgi:hypothetical protein